MKPKFILINPWIYDFAAVNMWSRPLGLLRVAEYLSQFDVDLHLIDCTDIFRRKRDNGSGNYPRHIVEKPEILKPVARNYARYGIPADVFIDKLKGLLPCSAVFVTSIMSYWYPGVQEAIAIVKALSPDTPVFLGGIYATLYHKHASQHSGADYIFPGHISHPPASPEIRAGNKNIRPLKNARPVERDRAEVKTRPLETVIEGAGIPLHKIRPALPYYKLALYDGQPFAPIMTSSGCPHRCTYCASFTLFNGFVQRAPSTIMKEIRELSALGVRDYAFYDDALLVNADRHMKPVLREIIASGLRLRFHCPNGLHVRYIDDELACLMKGAGFSTLRLSLETVNSARQIQTGDKVRTDCFRSAVAALKRHGFTKEDIGVYLMYGLPGQGLGEVKEGVKFLKLLEVRIHLTEFSPLPGTSCWNELIDNHIIQEDIDPLLTNNSVFSCLFSGYDVQSLARVKLDVKNYNAC